MNTTIEPSPLPVVTVSSWSWVTTEKGAFSLAHIARVYIGKNWGDASCLVLEATTGKYTLSLDDPGAKFLMSLFGLQQA
jgi:hypothetical protein